MLIEGLFLVSNFRFRHFFGWVNDLSRDCVKIGDIDLRIKYNPFRKFERLTDSAWEFWLIFAGPGIFFSEGGGG